MPSRSIAQHAQRAALRRRREGGAESSGGECARRAQVPTAGREEGSRLVAGIASEQPRTHTHTHHARTHARTHARSIPRSVSLGMPRWSVRKSQSSSPPAGQAGTSISPMATASSSSLRLGPARATAAAYLGGATGVAAHTGHACARRPSGAAFRGAFRLPFKHRNMLWPSGMLGLSFGDASLRRWHGQRLRRGGAHRSYRVRSRCDPGQSIVPSPPSTRSTSGTNSE